MLTSLIAGAVSGYCSISICYPLDNLRTRLQANFSNNTSSMSLLNMIKTIHKEEGIKGFYKGFWYPFAAQVIDIL